MNDFELSSRNMLFGDTINSKENLKEFNKNIKRDNIYMETKKKENNNGIEQTEEYEKNKDSYKQSEKKYKISNDNEDSFYNYQSFTLDHENSTTYENLSVKEFSDEEVSSENEYNQKIKINKNNSIKYNKDIVNYDKNDYEKKPPKNIIQNSLFQYEQTNDDIQNNYSVQRVSRTTHNVDEWINKLLKCQLLTVEEVKLMCTLLIDILKNEPNCVQVPVPVTVAGDIHGQFYDLLELFHIGGLPPDVSYLFLGDYVDRGYYSCECFCLVACFKIKHPSKVTILRGNHESRQITKVYGFYDECIRKYNNDSSVWKYLTDAFDYLPLTAIINNQIFCDHGGISPYLQTIEDINKLDRYKEIPQDGAICDLLWSDPASSEDEVIDGWKPSPRGAGVLFNEKKTNTFLHMNNLSCICRAHQLVQEGFQWMHNDKVVTIFSAPNYCYRCGNSASLMLVDEFMEKDFVTFNTAPLRANPHTLRNNVDYML
ncbi:protein phosphatase-beta, putative [Plasmodium chabaudi adami]|uniref:Serine/threonine-protein phosphatase n=1 Tax=Plasmodium chabaudi adami TaxID=5826 RepID=A0A1C6YAL2_PLACE|nr:protein phosphatase-beta, putative [Plasmodium chabaudi adami]